MIQSQGQIRAAIYVRSATIDQAVGDRIEAQATACRELAGSLGADVTTEYRDVGDGTSSNLPGLRAMLDAARRHDVDVVVCERPDRLARGVAKLHGIEAELGRLGVAVRYVAGDSSERRTLTSVLASLEAPTSTARKAR